MLKIYRPRSRFYMLCMSESIYFARLWFDFRFLGIEYMTAMLLDENAMLLEYLVTDRGNKEKVDFRIDHALQRAQSIGAKTVILLHNHPHAEYAVLSDSDINLYNECRKREIIYNVNVSRIVSMGNSGGQYYGSDIGIMNYNEADLELIKNHYVKQGLTPSKIKEEYVIIKDIIMGPPTRFSKKRDEKRIVEGNRMEELTKNDAFMYAFDTGKEYKGYPPLKQMPAESQKPKLHVVK